MLPRNCMGFDCSKTDAREARDKFMPWLHSLANSFDVHVEVREEQSASIRSFSAFELEGLGLWILHNNWSSVVGAVAVAPAAWFAYAVDQPFEMLEIPNFLRGWGPLVPSAIDLNRNLTDEHWQEISLSDRRYADKFKPTRVSHVLFNYWA